MKFNTAFKTTLTLSCVLLLGACSPDDKNSTQQANINQISDMQADKLVLFSKSKKDYNIFYQIESLTTGIDWVDTYLLKLRLPLQQRSIDLSNEEIRQKIAENYQEAFNRDFAEAKEFFESTKDYSPMSHSSDISLVYNIKAKNKNIITIEDLSSIYTGGAHGTENLHYYNFDLKSKNKINLTTLFKNTEQVKKELYSILKEQYKKDKSLTFFSSNYKNFRLPEDFYFTNKGIAFVYQPYEIGPYSQGSKSLVLDWNQAKPLFKKGISKEYFGY